MVRMVVPPMRQQALSRFRSRVSSLPLMSSLSCGMASPVKIDSSTVQLPSRTTRSQGTATLFWPLLTTITSPGKSRSEEISIVLSFLTTETLDEGFRMFFIRFQLAILCITTVLSNTINITRVYIESCQYSSIIQSRTQNSWNTKKGAATCSFIKSL